MNEQATINVADGEAPAAKTAKSFAKDHLALNINGLQVADAIALLQLIRRLVKVGAMEDYELASLAMLRSKLAKAIQDATGVNYDAATIQNGRKPGPGKNAH